ncbi:MAG: hypothetical protein R3B41_03070 [Candidatus Doudnabacteria bacterium]
MSNDLFATIGDLTGIIWLIISHGGWIVFVLLAIYILYQMYVEEIQGQFLATIDWTLFEIKPPKENITSFYNMEQVLIQLHTLFDNYNFQERMVEGRVVFSWQWKL